jgi:hypothetical protein
MTWNPSTLLQRSKQEGLIDAVEVGSALWLAGWTPLVGAHLHRWPDGCRRRSPARTHKSQHQALTSCWGSSITATQGRTPAAQPPRKQAAGRRTRPRTASQASAVYCSSVMLRHLEERRGPRHAWKDHESRCRCIESACTSQRTSSSTYVPPCAASFIDPGVAVGGQQGGPQSMAITPPSRRVKFFLCP